eukprot:scaffold30184_cov21-Tisochrysis_lutea.AAC.5
MSLQATSAHASKAKLQHMPAACLCCDHETPYFDPGSLTARFPALLHLLACAPATGNEHPCTLAELQQRLPHLPPSALPGLLGQLLGLKQQQVGSEVGGCC